MGTIFLYMFAGIGALTVLAITIIGGIWFYRAMQDRRLSRYCEEHGIEHAVVDLGNRGLPFLVIQKGSCSESRCPVGPGKD